MPKEIFSSFSMFAYLFKIHFYLHAYVKKRLERTETNLNHFNWGSV